MNTSEINSLLDKYLKGTSTPEENAMLETWYMRYQNKSLADVADQVRIDQLGKIRSQLEIHSSDGKVRKLWTWYKTAGIAAAVAAIVFGVWLFSSKYQDASIKTGSMASVNDVAPGKNGATITLANGKVIQLSDAKSGVVIGDELKYSDSTLVIQSDSEGSNGFLGTRNDKRTRNDKGGERSVMLTASTARGQTYQFTLPDGTRVWLNADSKISFPSQFSEQERKILLDGEGYFEVAKVYTSSRTAGRDRKRLPFLVESKGQTVEVLGTHFNINAYKDENVTTTTLLEGSVRVAAFNSASGRENIMLKPNQQSILDAGGAQVLNVNAEAAVSWKEGIFIFDGTPVATVMRQIERWYNVEVTYEDPGVKTRLLGGSMSRYDNVSRILKTIENTDAVRFKREGRMITVLR